MKKLVKQGVRLSFIFSLLIIFGCVSQTKFQIEANSKVGVIQPLTIGPMIGNVTEDSFRLWGRGAKSSIIVARFRLSDSKSSSGGKWSNPEFFEVSDFADYTGTIEFNQQQPNTIYEYQIGYIHQSYKSQLMDIPWSKEIRVNSVRTTPSDKANQPVRFVFGSCRDQAVFSKKGENTFRNIGLLLDHERENKMEPKSAFIIQAGDQVYADDSLFHKMNLIKTDTDDEFWELYQTAFSKTEYAKVLRSLPSYMILDDHEVINNWHKEDINNTSPYFPAIKAYSAYQASLNLTEGRKEPGENTSLTKRTAVGWNKYWYTFEYGNVDFFVLDTRSDNEYGEKDFRIIGEEQFNSLVEWLDGSRANSKNISSDKQSTHVKFIVSPVPFFPDTLGKIGEPEDKWAAGVSQRHKLLEHIRERKIKNVIFLSGDMHVSTIAELTYCKTKKQCEDDFKIYSIISSPFNWSITLGIGPQESAFDFDDLNPRSLCKRELVKGEDFKPVDNGCKFYRGYDPHRLSSNYYVRRYKGSPNTPLLHKQNNFSRITVTEGVVNVEFYSGRTGELLESSNIWLK